MASKKITKKATKGAKKKPRENTPQGLEHFNTNINKALMLKAMQNNRGNISRSCLEVGCSRESFYNFYKQDPEFKAQIDELKEVRLDIYEEKLLELAEDKNITAIIFGLNNQGGSRGYHPPGYVAIQNPDDATKDTVLARLYEFQNIQRKFKAENK